ncbi:MAG: CfrBI family restriction endonuclease [Anaerolineaceae bacterium]|nr:CfrBI family restriction endonuclease [Anaerolineaceae bacterium]
MTKDDDIRRVDKAIRHLLRGEDYRIVIISEISELFLKYALTFFHAVVKAKLQNQHISQDWYKASLLNPEYVNHDEIITHSGLNKKTIQNRFGSTRRKIILDVTEKHYNQLRDTIANLVDSEDELDIKLTIRLRDVSVDLSINESLIVITALAVKRSQIRGGAWSRIGKQVEIPLMRAICEYYQVSSEHYRTTSSSGEGREVDFVLMDRLGNAYNCEVKLMGRGNPESADAAIARNSQIFVADSLSDLNKRQLAERGVHWVELRSEQGFRRLRNILKELQIPHQEQEETLEEWLSKHGVFS